MRRPILVFACTVLMLAAPASAQRLIKDSDPAAGQTYTVSSAPAREGGAQVSLMSWDKVAGNWKVFKGKVRQQWGKLTNNDLQIAAGKRDVLVGRIQARYGIDKAKADQQVELWLKEQPAQ